MTPQEFKKLPLKRSWFERSLETGRMILREERLDARNDMLLTCAFPLRGNGRVDTS